MNISLIFALETKCWGNMFVAFLFRVSLYILTFKLLTKELIKSEF